MVVVTYLLLLLSVSGLAHYCLAVYAGVRFFRGATDPPHASEGSAHNVPHAVLPPVSILKPISGADEETYENLASFCRQTYPRFEIIFGVQKEDDSSIPIIERLARDFPGANIRYAVCRSAIGTNHKVSNLATAYERAKYDLLVLSDSDVHVRADYLTDIAQPFAGAKIGVVTCLYRSRAKGMIATFEALGVATESCPIDLLSRQLEGMRFAMGPTIAIRRPVLESIGGFTTIADYLHDDYLLGNMLFRAGHEIVLSHHIVDHVMGSETWIDLVHRQTRWARGTRSVRPLGYLGLVFTYGTIWSFLFLLTSGGSALGWLVLGAVWAARYSMAWLIGVHYLGDEIARKWLPIVPLRDLMGFTFWVYGFAGDTIVWRGRCMQLLRGGKLAQGWTRPNA